MLTRYRAIAVDLQRRGDGLFSHPGRRLPAGIFARSAFVSCNFLVIHIDNTLKMSKIHMRRMHVCMTVCRLSHSQSHVWPIACTSWS